MSYSKVSRSYWQGELAAAIRSSGVAAECHAIASFLMTGPFINTTGICRVTPEMVAGELGIEQEGACQGASDAPSHAPCHGASGSWNAFKTAWQILEENKFFVYDSRHRVLWIRRHLQHQFDGNLQIKPGDKRRPMIERYVSEWAHCCFYPEFISLYSAFNFRAPATSPVIQEGACQGASDAPSYAPCHGASESSEQIEIEIELKEEGPVGPSSSKKILRFEAAKLVGDAEQKCPGFAAAWKDWRGSLTTKQTPWAVVLELRRWVKLIEANPEGVLVRIAHARDRGWKSYQEEWYRNATRRNGDLTRRQHLEFVAPASYTPDAPIDVPARLGRLADALLGHPGDSGWERPFYDRVLGLEGDAEAVEEQLVALDRDLLAAARDRLGDGQWEELSRRLETSLASLARRLPRAELERAREQLIEQLLRTELDLPVLSLFAVKEA